MAVPVFEVPGKISVTWEPGVRAIVDTWTTYNVSLAEFKEAVLVKGVGQAKAGRAQAWIVDSSAAKGAFSQEIQAFIGSDVFPTFAAIGIKYFITVTSQSAVTKMSIASYTAKAGPHGLKLVEASSAQGALDWLKANAT